MHKNIIVEKSTELALEIIEFTSLLKKEKHYQISSQLFRSGTSIGANVWEAQNEESSKDFIHKFKIAAKESDESEYWLELCKASKHLPTPEEQIFKDRESISKVLSKIIGTTKRNMNG
ncbi:MAG: four helix bundle protein [Nonlabens sp.]|jgi:four helix bundle protein